MDFKNLHPTVKHEGGSIMRGCMKPSGIASLVIIDEILNKDECLHILRENLKQSVEELWLLEDFRFLSKQRLEVYYFSYCKRMNLMQQVIVETPPNGIFTNQILTEN